MGDEQYVEHKRSDRVYLSKTFVIGREGDQHQARYIARVFDDTNRSAFDTVDGEMVIRTTHNDKVQIKAVVTTDSHQLQQLTIQSFRLYKKEGWQPEQQFGINLRGEEISRLVQFVRLATSLDVPAVGKVRIDEDSLSQFDIDDAARAWLKQNPQVLAEMAEHQITTKDVVAIAYRKRELGVFARLLDDQSYFDGIAESKFKGKPESVWQAFFERNRWVFGYGLFYLSASGLSERKLEQAVSGATVASDGKRADALLRTRGRVSSICLVEIKHHRTPLLRDDRYRSGAWQPSSELTGAVSQSQATVDGVERQFRDILPGRDAEGNATGEDAVIARPRSVVVCGSLSEFVGVHGINHPRFRSFELYRRHLISPDIITFDELYERAKLIVESVDEASQASSARLNTGSVKKGAD